MLFLSVHYSNTKYSYSFGMIVDVRAITGNDYFLMQGIIMYVILAIAFLLLIVDMIYPLIDPRIKYRTA